LNISSQQFEPLQFPQNLKFRSVPARASDLNLFWNKL